MHSWWFSGNLKAYWKHSSDDGDDDGKWLFGNGFECGASITRCNGYCSLYDNNYIFPIRQTFLPSIRARAHTHPTIHIQFIPIECHINNARKLHASHAQKLRAAWLWVCCVQYSECPLYDQVTAAIVEWWQRRRGYSDSHSIPLHCTVISSTLNFRTARKSPSSISICWFNNWIMNKTNTTNLTTKLHAFAHGFCHLLIWPSFA